MKYFFAFYNSFLLSLTISILCFSSEWLEMRINVGYIFLALLATLFILILNINRRNEVKQRFALSLGNMIIFIVVGILFYGMKRIFIVPASIIREGLHITSVSFGAINAILIVFSLIGLLLMGNRK